MMKYSKYKDSGINWLGQMPVHWSDSHLKRVCKLIKDGTHGSFQRVNSGYPLLSVRNIVDNLFVNLADDSMISEVDYISIVKSFRVREGDLQLAIVGATMGKVALVPKLNPFATQRSIATIRTDEKKLFNKYLFYFIQAVKFQKNLWSNTNYSAQPGIYLGTIEAISVFLPPFDEQTVIAQYLDSKTQAIDKKINLLVQKANTYKELRKSVINVAVCKGLDKSVELKESENVFHVNHSWKRFRLKDVGSLYSGLSGKSGDDFNQDDNPRNKGFIPFTNIANSTYVNTLQLGTVVIDEKEKQNKVRQGDLFFLMSSEGYEDIGKSAVLAEEIKDTYLNSFCKGFRISNKNCDSYFLNYLLLSDNYRKALITEGKGFTRINLKMEKVNDFIIYLPDSIEEQTAIVNYLDQKTQKIDAIVSNIGRQIEILKELRKTLINDVVTGKIKVTPN